MTNTNEALLPCPFCGGEAEHMILSNDYTDWYGIRCSNFEDGCVLNNLDPAYEYKEDAIAAWNTRAALTANTLPTSGENVSNAPDVVVIPREEFDRIILRLNIIKEGNCYNSRIDANSALEILQKHGEKI